MRKRTKSKTMAGILATSMILGGIVQSVSYLPLQESVVVYAESNLLTYKENGFDIENGVLRRYNGQESNLEIPEGVIEIGEYAFERNESIKTITFPKSLTTIKSHAFAYCTNLKTVNTNENLEKIENHAFIVNTSLETIDLSHVKIIGDIAFNLCEKLDKIDLSSAEQIGGSAFLGTGIQEVEWEVKEDLKGTGIFENCTLLKKVHLSGKVTCIPKNFFKNCTALEEIQIDTMDEITDVGMDAFTGTPWQQKKMEENEDHMFIINDILVKYLPNTYYAGDEEETYDDNNIRKIIYSYTEPQNTIMEEVVVPENVTKIAPKAFYGAYSVKNITFPKGIEEVGEAAFDYTKWLEEYLEEEHYLIINKHLVKIWNQLEKVEIPSNVIHINSCAYPSEPQSGNRADVIPKTKEVIVPVTVTEIEMGGLPAFDAVNNKGCENVEKFILPKSFEHAAIPVYIPMGTKVEYKDVESSTTGKDLSGDITTKPSQSPTAKPSESPTGTPSQSPTGTPNQNPTGTPSQSPTETPSQSPTGTPSQSPAVPTPPAKNTVLTDTKNKCKVKVASASAKNPTVIYTKSTNAKASSITIPATVTINRVTYKVTGVATSAFSGNKKLTKVTIGKNITIIGKNAFKNCSKLKMVRIKSSVLKAVGSKAIKGTNKRLVIKVPSKKVSVYKKLFKGKGNAKVKVKK